MRAVIQRCLHATVTVGGEQISSIGRGMMVLIGIHEADTQEDADYIAKQLLKVKLFPAEEEEAWGWKQNVIEAGFEVLCVSQFTLYATLKKGKPDFRRAMTAESSKQFYLSFLETLKTQYQPTRIRDGEFGAMMDVQLTNDGPVTLILDSREDLKPSSSGTTTPAPSISDAKRKKKDLWEAKARRSSTATNAVVAAAPNSVAPSPDTVVDLEERIKNAMLEQY